MGLVTNWLRFSVTSHLTCLYLNRGLKLEGVNSLRSYTFRPKGPPDE
jgi:hypothetical protein